MAATYANPEQINKAYTTAMLAELRQTLAELNKSTAMQDPSAPECEYTRNHMIAYQAVCKAIHALLTPCFVIEPPES
jgi:hypothetical protein